MQVAKQSQGQNQKNSPNMLTGSTRGGQEVELEPDKVESRML